MVGHPSWCWLQVFIPVYQLNANNIDFTVTRRDYSRFDASGVMALNAVSGATIHGSYRNKPWWLNS